MQNSEIADVFEEMADLLELGGESPFRVRAYRAGAQVLRDFPDSVRQWVEEGRDLTTIDGIGDTLAEKTKTVVTTGRLPQLEKLRQEIPASLRGLMAIPGLGAKKVATLYRELGVLDLATLKEACEAQRVRGLKGFGAKTEQSILDGIAIAEHAGKRLNRDQADALVDRLRRHLVRSASIVQFEFAGSYRRGRETVGDIDILVVSPDPQAAMDHFLAFDGKTELIAHGPTKSSMRVAHAFQVDMRVVDEPSFGAALQYFTGSKEHNVVLRGMAKKQGYKLNEYGLFPLDEEQHAVAGRDEAEIYRTLGLPWMEPEFRENRFEWREDFVDFAKHIVRLEDMRGDLHMHTCETDGENTLDEMAREAQRRGLDYIAITDHSKRVSMARGMNAERLLAQWQAVDEFNQNWKGPPFLVMKGIECDILEDGEMDLPDEVLAAADWVMASIHYGQRQSREQITDRLLRAIRHPHVSAISHPTGRLLGRREPYAVDLDAVFQAAHEYGKYLEINANPMRLDLSDIHCQMAAAHGVDFVISTDAHSVSQLALLHYGVQVARRAGLHRQRIVNCQPLDAWRDRLALRHPG